MALVVLPAGGTANLSATLPISGRGDPYIPTVWNAPGAWALSNERTAIVAVYRATDGSGRGRPRPPRASNDGQLSFTPLS